MQFRVPEKLTHAPQSYETLDDILEQRKKEMEEQMNEKLSGMRSTYETVFKILQDGLDNGTQEAFIDISHMNKEMKELAISHFKMVMNEKGWQVREVPKSLGTRIYWG